MSSELPPNTDVRGFSFKDVDIMTMVEYLKSARMTDDERAAWVERFGTPRKADMFPGEDTYEAHSHHAEYGGAQH